LKDLETEANAFCRRIGGFASELESEIVVGEGQFATAPEIENLRAEIAEAQGRIDEIRVRQREVAELRDKAERLIETAANVRKDARARLEELRGTAALFTEHTAELSGVVTELFERFPDLAQGPVTATATNFDCLRQQGRGIVEKYGEFVRQLDKARERWRT
jgi:predicted nuclease with TOPRIM domain